MGREKNPCFARERALISRGWNGVLGACSVPRGRAQTPPELDHLFSYGWKDQFGFFAVGRYVANIFPHNWTVKKYVSNKRPGNYDGSTRAVSNI